ncbi:MAG: hypothetical protein PW790_00500 [Parvibaculaceae bacterium]|nr:hypothetical protein [Parvibaculaceae bacterium]
MSIPLHKLGGLWRRSLIAWPDGREDRSTSVFWLQGPRHYIDLRQPAGRPSFETATCLDALDRDQVGWLAGQEGFAGLFSIEDGIGEWQRALDFQPWSGTADKGTLAFEGDVLVENGIAIPYLEHWHQALSPAPATAFVLEEAGTGRKGFLVRHGDSFMYARDRAVTLPLPGADNSPMEAASLKAIVAAAPLAEARAMIDCEISFGEIGADGWRIAHSSLPFREGTPLAPDIDVASRTLSIADISADGTPQRRLWKITDQEERA